MVTEGNIQEQVVAGAWHILKDEYLSLWGRTDLSQQLEQAHSAYWKEGFGSGHLTTFFENAKPVATVALSPVNPKTWMLHHYGVPENIRADKKKFLDLGKSSCLRILQAAYNQPGLEYVAMFLEADKRWNSFLYESLVTKHNNQNELTWLPFRVYRSNFTEKSVNVGIEHVRLASHTELTMVKEALIKNKCNLEQNAFLWNENLGIADFESSQHVESDRSRTCFVHAPGSHPKAAIILECGNEGANLFGLLNVSRIVFLDDNMSSLERGRAILNLLNQSKTWYYNNGKHTCLFFDERQELQIEPNTGFHFVSEGRLWLGKKKMVPILCAHLTSVFDEAISKL